MKRPFIYCISMASEKELSNLMCTGREETAAAFLLARQVGADRWTGRRYYDASSRKDNRSRSASYWTYSRARFAKYVSLRRKALAAAWQLRHVSRSAIDVGQEAAAAIILMDGCHWPLSTGCEVQWCDAT